MNNAAVTICSLNYISKALVLRETFLQFNPDDDFYICIVDRKVTVNDIPLDVKLLWVEDLEVPDLLKHAFAFDVIEFNTNVKPTVLRKLLCDYSKVLYIDPDVEVFSSFEYVYELLEHEAVVLTPHYTKPIFDGCKPDDIDLLKFGAFNLGFVAVSRHEQSLLFLDWWSERCLELGYYDPPVGLAVDQKWVTLAPAFFDRIYILKHPGYNVAFWNLHERLLSKRSGVWMVNELPLVFVHFSSFNAKDPEAIANKQNRFAKGDRPDFAELCQLYASKLLSNELNSNVLRYSFDYFDNGVYITPALRRFYSIYRFSRFNNLNNPFDSQGAVYDFANKNSLVVKGVASQQRITFKTASDFQRSRKIINIGLRVTLRLLGPVRYYNFMRYLSVICSIRNQDEVLK